MEIPDLSDHATADTSPQAFSRRTQRLLHRKWPTLAGGLVMQFLLAVGVVTNAMWWVMTGVWLWLVFAAVCLLAYGAAFYFTIAQHTTLVAMEQNCALLEDLVQALRENAELQQQISQPTVEVNMAAMRDALNVPNIRRILERGLSHTNNTGD